MSNATREPSAVGELLLNRLADLKLRRSTLARRLGLDPRFMWEIIWGTRPFPLERITDLAEALQLTQEQSNAIIVANSTDRLKRSRDRREAAATRPG